MQTIVENTTVYDRLAQIVAERAQLQSYGVSDFEKWDRQVLMAPDAPQSFLWVGYGHGTHIIPQGTGQARERFETFYRDKQSYEKLLMVLCRQGELSITTDAEEVIAFFAEQDIVLPAERRSTKGYLGIISFDQLLASLPYELRTFAEWREAPGNGQPFPGRWHFLWEEHKIAGIEFDYSLKNALYEEYREEVGIMLRYAQGVEEATLWLHPFRNSGHQWIAEFVVYNPNAEWDKRTMYSGCILVDAETKNISRHH